MHHWIEERLYPLRHVNELQQRIAVWQAWDELDDRQRFVWNKVDQANRVANQPSVLTVRG